MYAWYLQLLGFTGNDDKHAIYIKLDRDMNNSICSIFETAISQYADYPAILIDAETLSYRELGHRAKQVAELLSSVETDNSRVALLAENGINYVILYWGILLAGKVSVELNPGLADKELLNQLNKSDSGIRIAEKIHAVRILDVDSSCAELSILIQSSAMTSQKNQSMSFRLAEILEGCNPGQIASSLPAPMPDAVASIVYTSGTTGEVKGVCLTHNNLGWTVKAIACSLGLNAGRPVECFSGHLPLYYTYGKSILLLATYLGSPIVFTEQVITPRNLLQILETQKVTHLPLVPYLANLLLRLVEFNAQRLTHLRVITVAGGALSVESISQLQQRFPDGVILMYGLTEASTRVTCMPPGEINEHSSSCGKPLPGVAVNIVSENGQSCSPGEVGEVWVRGDNIMTGYYRDQQATAKVIQDGWLRTGDLGCLDRHGYLTISGRSKDIIKVMGESISASSIEATINRITGVSEVAVLGIPDKTRGEAICAYIIAENDVELNADSIRQYCAKELGAVRVPTYVRFVPDIPKTASGKMRKHLLTLK